MDFWRHTVPAYGFLAGIVAVMLYLGTMAFTNPVRVEEKIVPRGGKVTQTELAERMGSAQEVSLDAQTRCQVWASGKNAVLYCFPSK